MARKRNHGLFISFTVDDSKKACKHPLILVRMPKHFINQKDWRHELYRICHHHNVPLAGNVLGMDSVTDDPAIFTEDDLQWSGNRYYKERYEKEYPRFMEKFDTRPIDPDWLPDFELWDWQYHTSCLQLVRERTKKS